MVKKTAVIYLDCCTAIDNKTKGLKLESYGSELAAINLAKEFSKDGYEAYIITILECPEVKIDDVNYMNTNEFSLLNLEIDVLIVSRYLSYFLNFSFNAKKIYIWVHDVVLAGTYDQDHISLLYKFIDKVDGIIVLSEWHKAYFNNVYRLTLKDQDKIKIIGNGTNVSVYPTVPKKKGKFIYTSNYNRGLYKLVDYFHEIRKKIPYAELHIYRDYQGHEMLVSELKKYDYIFVHGKCTNEEVISAFAESEVWFYPTNWAETYCISALEAQLSGCICIATDLAALSNIVNDRGILLSPEIINNKELCLKTVFSVLSDTAMCQKLTESAKKWALEQDWGKIYLKWKTLISRNNSDDRDDDKNVKIEIKCVNLEKRVDRKIEMIRKFSQQGITNYSFFKAVNGKELKPTEKLRLLFLSNDFNYRKGVMGCALSHINLWKMLENDQEKLAYLILEDDVEISPHFKSVISTLDVKKLINAQVDIVFVGYMKRIPDKKTFEKEKTDFTIKKFNRENFYSGAFGYLVTKSGARKLLDRKSFLRAIDYAFFDTKEKLNIYEIDPLIIKTDVAWYNNVDTDIQRDFESLKFETYSLISSYIKNYLDIVYNKPDEIFLVVNGSIELEHHKNYDTLMKEYISLVSHDAHADADVDAHVDVDVDIVVIGWKLPDTERLQNITKYFIGFPDKKTEPLEEMPPGAIYLVKSTGANKLLQGEKVSIVQSLPHLVFYP